MSIKFLQTLSMRFHFGQNQDFRLVIYEEKFLQQNHIIYQHLQHLSEGELKLQRLVSQRGEPLEIDAIFANKYQSYSKGKFIIKNIRSSTFSTGDTLKLVFDPVSEGLSKGSQYYYVVSKEGDYDTPNLNSTVYEKSRVLKHGSTTENIPVSIQILDLVNRNHTKNQTHFDFKKEEIMISMYTLTNLANESLVGNTTVIIDDIMSSPTSLEFVNILTNKTIKTGIKEAEIIRRPIFIDYVNSHLDMTMMVGIDFTSSNGYPHGVTTLHSMNMNKNQYLMTIRVMGEIILEF